MFQALDFQYFMDVKFTWRDDKKIFYLCIILWDISQIMCGIFTNTLVIAATTASAP